MTVRNRGPLRCITYSRVSTRGQVERGFSLGQQGDATRAYAEVKGYEIVAEIEDAGYSGAYLERPGLERVRDLVETGDIDLVLVQDLDRLTREPGHLWLLEQEFELHGCEIRALNDDGDRSPEGDLMRGVKAQVAKYERAKINERMRRGKKAKARSGKVLPARPAPYGFVHREDDVQGSVLVVDEARMVHVRKAFRIVAEGGSVRSVKKAFDEVGVPTPGGAKTWTDSTIRRWFDSDVYKPHTFEEVRALVAPGVAAKLDDEALYGIFYYNQLRTKKSNGHHTRKTNDRTEWISVPIPNAGIPKKHVEKARAAVADNVRPPDAGRRFWELKSLLFCLCGRRTTTFTARRKYKNKEYFTYHHVCSEMRRKRMGGCEHSRYHTAYELEGRVRAFVLSLLRDPEAMRRRVEEDVKRECERLRRADGEKAGWFAELAEVERKRDVFVEMWAEGDISREKYREKIAALDARKTAAEEELGRLEGGAESVKALDALPGLVEAFLRDLPSLVGDPIVVRDYATVPAERTEENPLGVYTLTPENIRHLTAEEQEEKRREAERRRGERFRRIYEALELRAVVQRTGHWWFPARSGWGRRTSFARSRRTASGTRAVVPTSVGRDERGRRRGRSPGPKSSRGRLLLAGGRSGPSGAAGVG